MGKKTLLLTVLLAALFSGVKADVDPNFYIYLCFGQSNMEGNATPETVDKTNVPERFQMLACVNFNSTSPKRTMGKWYKAVPPIVRDGTGLGMADWFGRTMVQQLPGKKIGVVDVAVGGTSIRGFMQDEVAAYIASMNPSSEGWLINYFKAYDNDPYKRLVDMAKIAQKDGIIKGILLHQGCTDNTMQDWPQKVKKIYDQLIADLNLNATEVPLFVGELASQAAGGSCWAHNAIIDKVPNVIPNSYVISSTGCPQKGDGLHFTAAGYRTMGRRYAVAALSAMGITPPYFSFYETDFIPNSKSTYTEKTRTITAKEGGTVSWTYANGADWSKNKYLVVKLKQPQTAKAEIMICNMPNNSIAYWEAIGEGTTIVIDLQTAKYKGTKLDPAKVSKMSFRAKQAGTIVFDDVFLSNDGSYAVYTDINEVNSSGNLFKAPLYSLDGRLVQPDALKPGFYIQAGKKTVIR